MLNTSDHGTTPPPSVQNPSDSKTELTSPAIGSYPNFAVAKMIQQSMGLEGKAYSTHTYQYTHVDLLIIKPHKNQ